MNATVDPLPLRTFPEIAAAFRQMLAEFELVVADLREANHLPIVQAAAGVDLAAVERQLQGYCAELDTTLNTLRLTGELERWLQTNDGQTHTERARRHYLNMREALQCFRAGMAVATTARGEQADA